MKKIYALLIIIAMLFAACQPTPKGEVVNQRNFEKLLEVNQQDEKQEYPDLFIDEVISKDGKVKITFDAKVIAPEVDKFPVIQINPHPITEDLMQIVVDEFMGGETGYYPESYMTKSEIEERLLNYYAKLDNDELIKEEYEKNMPDAEIDYDAVKEAIARRIAEYTNMLENAPEEKENVPSYYNLRPDMFYITDDHNYRDAELSMTQEQLDTRAANLRENLYLISDRQIEDDFLRLIVYNELPTLPGQPHNFGLHSAEYYGLHIIRARNDYLQLFTRPLSSASPTNGSCEGVENFDAPYPDLTINEDEAVKLAQQVLDDLNIGNFYLANTRIRKEYPSIEGWQSGFDWDEQDDKFYILTFKPSYYGIPLIYANNRYSEQEQISLPFTFEEIKMKVSNDVVVEFSWANPTDVSNVLNESAKLLPFDEIADIATSHMKLKYNMVTIAPVWEESPTYKEDLARFLGAEIKITEIRLGLGGVPAYNNTGEYMLIPVWSFYGSVILDDKYDEYEETFEDLLMPLLSINAVDGSVIEQMTWADYD